MSKKKNNLNYIPASAKTAAQKQEEAKQSKRENLSPEARAKLLKKRAWTLSAISLCFVLVLTLSILFASYTPTYYNEKTNKEPDPTVVSGIIANEQFGLSDVLYNGKVSNSLQQPYQPSGWTLTEKSVDQAVAGAISLKDDSKDKVKKDLEANGVSTDDADAILTDTQTAADADKDVLLIYNKTATGTRAYSSSFSVAANSYLKITVRARTSVDNGGAFISFKTSASDSKAAERAFTGISHSDWKEYTFYVEGNKTSSKTIYLFVGLGTSSDPVEGWAQFDYAKAEKIKKANYIKQVEDPDPSEANFVKTKSYVENKNDNDLFKSKIAPKDSAITGVAPMIGELNDLPFHNASVLPVYKLANTTTDGLNSTFMKLADTLDVDQSTASSYYRLSFWAKTTDLKKETGAYFYVRLTTGSDKTVAYKSIDLVSTSTSDSDLNSGWEEFVFLFKPDNNTSYEAEIVFSLGALVYSEQNGYQPAISNVDTTGSLYVTEFELKEIFASEYSSASSNGNVAKVELTSGGSTGLITNGSFDAPVSNASGEGVHDPNGWTVEFPRQMVNGEYKYVPHAESDIEFGIKSKIYASASDRETWFAHTGSDNILYVNAKQDTAVGFISNSFTIPANSQYVISVLVKTSGNAVANVYLTGDVEQSFEVDTVDADEYFAWNDFVTGGYTKYNFVIKTGDKAKQVALELWAGSKDAKYENNAWTGLTPANSTIAFDQASADSITAEQFEKLVETENVFTKTETEDYIKDEDGNQTEEKEVVDVKYETTKQNVWVRDFSYADETGAVDVEDETEEEKDDTVVEPINWIMFSSLILSFAVIIFLVAVICKKFKKVQKQKVVEDFDPDYKK
ncbi:MAG: hypothetical protein IKV34_01680 [Clostridia bacterium]|nr:hypothetical protein [Clostridia bacterium]